MNKNAAKKGGTAKRLLSYVLKGYKFRCFWGASSTIISRPFC